MVAQAAQRTALASRARRINRELARLYPGARIELNFASPLELLVAAVLSAQTTDRKVNEVTRVLFTRYRTAADYAAADQAELAKVIEPTGYFHAKANTLIALGQALCDRFGGEVPDTLGELVTLPGVGRKTANLVLILSFKSLKNICVDTHVHRISNRLGWVRTRTPDETERALYRSTHERWWPYINLYLVTWGQNVCRPIYPRCGACVIREHCPRIGVTQMAKR